MSAHYSDPTAEAIERSERRGCFGCDWRARMFGAEFCCNPNHPEHRRPHGKENMRGCLDHQRDGRKSDANP